MLLWQQIALFECQWLRISTIQLVIRHDGGCKISQYNLLSISAPLQTLFTQVLRGSKTSPSKPQWKTCLASAKSLELATGRLYVENYFPPEAKAIVSTLLQNLLTAKMNQRCKFNISTMGYGMQQHAGHKIIIQLRHPEEGFPIKKFSNK